MEVKKMFAVALTYSRGEEKSEEALLMARMRMAEEASEEPEGRHFDDLLFFADELMVLIEGMRST